MEVLLHHLVTRGRAALDPLLVRVRQGEASDPNPDPFKTLWVLSEQPFLARDRLRLAAKTFIDDVQKPILRVNGLKDSGKTYSVQFLEYIMQQARPGLHVVHEELVEGTGTSYDLEELGKNLTVNMRSKSRMPERAASAYSTNLARWVIESAVNEGGLWIFVLDGFGQPIKGEVKEFIFSLAKRVAAPETAKMVRLALIDFKEDPFLGNWRPKTIDDPELVPGGITRESIAACLRAWDKAVASRPQGGRVTPPEKIDDLADEMLKLCPSNDPAQQLPVLYNLLHNYATST